MDSPPTLTVLSLGGEVQSSVMALVASEGAFDRLLDCAIFADTQRVPGTLRRVSRLRLWTSSGAKVEQRP